MTGITQSISDLLGAILNTIKSLFDTLLSGLEGILAIFGTAVEDVAALGKGIVDLILGECCERSEHTGRDRMNRTLRDRREQKK